MILKNRSRGLFAFTARAFHNAEPGTGGGAAVGAPPEAAPVVAPVPVAAPVVPVVPPVVVQAPAVPVVVPPVAAPPATVPEVGDPSWVEERLKRERRVTEQKTLAALGVTDINAAKAAIAAANEAAEKAKTEAQRLAEAQATMAALTVRSNAMNALLDQQAADAFTALTEAQKTAVRTLAADDAPVEDRLKAIRAIRALANGTAVPAVAPVVAAPVVPAATTVPTATAPAGATTSPPDNRALYEQTRADNPFAAAKIGLAHPGEVYKTK